MTEIDGANLLALARKAIDHAYAPYSSLKVGAAALTEDGDVYSGSNIENAAYSPTICAERVALFSARSDGKKVVAIAIAANSGRTCPPCGVCRQVLWELARDAVVILESGIRPFETHTVQELLPFAFGPEDLDINPGQDKMRNLEQARQRQRRG